MSAKAYQVNPKAKSEPEFRGDGNSLVKSCYDVIRRSKNAVAISTVRAKVAKRMDAVEEAENLTIAHTLKRLAAKGYIKQVR